MKTIRRVAIVAAGTAMLCTAGLATAGTASASMGGPYSSCSAEPLWDYCTTFYYNSNLQGAHTAFAGPDANFADNKFLSSGAGQGQILKNNAASASFWVRPGGIPMYSSIFYNSNNQGPCDAIAGGRQVMRLYHTYNENASYDASANPNVWAGCYLFN